MKHNKLLINLIVFAILLTVGFGCKSINLPSLNGGGVSESTNPKDAVQTAYKKFADAKFYHSVTTSKNSMATIETELDFNAPDRIWIKNKMPNMVSEVIAIGTDSYSRLNDGKWTKMPAGQALNINDMRGKMMNDAVAAMKDFEAAGKESVNGKDTLVYTFNSTYGGESNSKIWVSTASGLPLKVDTDGSYGGTKVQISIIYDYDKETKIEAPKVN
jgi:outer membrane lipoprotein-sorting protein